jgi:hypothetical protein
MISTIVQLILRGVDFIFKSDFINVIHEQRLHFTFNKCEYPDVHRNSREICAFILQDQFINRIVTNVLE